MVSNFNPIALRKAKIVCSFGLSAIELKKKSLLLGVQMLFFWILLAFGREAKMKMFELSPLSLQGEMRKINPEHVLLLLSKFLILI